MLVEGAAAGAGIIPGAGIFTGDTIAGGPERSLRALARSVLSVGAFLNTTLGVCLPPPPGCDTSDIADRSVEPLAEVRAEAVVRVLAVLVPLRVVQLLFVRIVD